VAVMLGLPAMLLLEVMLLLAVILVLPAILLPAVMLLLAVMLALAVPVAPPPRRRTLHPYHLLRTEGWICQFMAGLSYCLVR
jgi:hypothetical protein